MNEFKYGAVMLPLPSHLVFEVLKYQKLIDPSDVVELEDDPHITVKYGVDPSIPVSEVRRVLSGIGPINVVLGRTSLFELPDQEVLKLEVTSPSLITANLLVRKHLKCIDTYPTYIPHVTLAYLKTGSGSKYEGIMIPKLSGESHEFTHVKYSDRDSNKHVISLGSGCSPDFTGNTDTISNMIDSVVRGVSPYLIIERADVKTRTFKVTADDDTFDELDKLFSMLHHNPGHSATFGMEFDGDGHQTFKVDPPPSRKYGGVDKTREVCVTEAALCTWCSGTGNRSDGSRCSRCHGTGQTSGGDQFDPGSFKSKHLRSKLGTREGSFQ